MKKILFVFLFAIAIAGCSRSEKESITKDLMPIVERDRPSTDYLEAMELVKPEEVPGEELWNFGKRITSLDPEAVENEPGSLSGQPFAILHYDPANDYVLYMVTPSGVSCNPAGFMNSGCKNASLKILDTTNNSISLLTENFGDGLGQVYFNNKDNSIVVYNLESYEIFSNDKTYQLLESAPVNSSSLLINEYVASYIPESQEFLLKNLLEEDESISCIVENPRIASILNKNFDYQHFYIAPNGEKLLILDGNDKFYWNQISSEWNQSSGECFSDLEEGTLNGIESVTRNGKWYADSDYFAVSEYGADVFVYDFDNAEQILYMPFENTLNIGYMSNTGYHNFVDLDDGKGRKIVIVPKEYSVALELENQEGDRIEIARYSDDSSLTSFQDAIEEYPVNSLGRNTSRELNKVDGVPDTWARIYKDDSDKNLYHVLVLEDYDVKHAFDLFVDLAGM